MEGPSLLSKSNVGSYAIASVRIVSNQRRASSCVRCIALLASLLLRRSLNFAMEIPPLVVCGFQGTLRDLSVWESNWWSRRNEILTAHREVF